MQIKRQINREWESESLGPVRFELWTNIENNITINIGSETSLISTYAECFVASQKTSTKCVELHLFSVRL